jgi:hypothetical protein
MRIAVEIHHHGRATVAAFEGDVHHALLARIVDALDRAGSGSPFILDLNAVHHPAYTATQLVNRMSRRGIGAADLALVCAAADGLATTVNGETTTRRLPLYPTVADALTGLATSNDHRISP